MLTKAGTEVMVYINFPCHSIHPSPMSRPLPESINVKIDPGKADWPEVCRF